MAAGMILAGISGREHGSGSKRSFPLTPKSHLKNDWIGFCPRKGLPKDAGTKSVDARSGLITSMPELP